VTTADDNLHNSCIIEATVEHSAERTRNSARVGKKTWAITGRSYDLRKSSIRSHCILEGWGMTIKGCTKILGTISCCWQDGMCHVHPQGSLAITLVQTLTTRHPSFGTAFSTTIFSGLVKPRNLGRGITWAFTGNQSRPISDNCFRDPNVGGRMKPDASPLHENCQRGRLQEADSQGIYGKLDTRKSRHAVS
jgi:hypothetical protein